MNDTQIEAFEQAMILLENAGFDWDCQEDEDGSDMWVIKLEQLVD